MNQYVTAVLDAATDPGLAGDEASALRERLERAGLLAPGRPVRSRPSRRVFERARAAASQGTPVSTLVEQGR